MLLAIDTSGPFCSAAVLAGDDVYERSENLGRGHAEHLMGMLEDVLWQAEAAWPDIDCIACATGPGSFTGLRVGLATAKGLALALNCPCIGVTVFDAFAFEFANGEPLCVAMDARRNEIWMQSFNSRGKPDHAPLAVPSEQAVDHLPAGTRRVAGSAATGLADKIESGQVLSDLPSPPIKALARLAATLPAPQHPPVPLYLRAPDAKPQASLV